MSQISNALNATHATYATYVEAFMQVCILYTEAPEKVTEKFPIMWV